MQPPARPRGTIDVICDLYQDPDILAANPSYNRIAPEFANAVTRPSTR